MLEQVGHVLLVKLGHSVIQQERQVVRIVTMVPMQVMKKARVVPPVWAKGESLMLVIQSVILVV